jgi:hypothetical protein
VVALAWLDLDRGNGSVGSWDGCRLAFVTMAHYDARVAKPRQLSGIAHGAMSAFK